MLHGHRRYISLMTLIYDFFQRLISEVAPSFVTKL